MNLSPSDIKSIMRISNYVSIIDCILNLTAGGCIVLGPVIMEGNVAGRVIAVALGIILLAFIYTTRGEIGTRGFDILMLLVNKKAKAVVDDLILFNEWTSMCTPIEVDHYEDLNRKLCIKYLCLLTFACRKDAKLIFSPLQAEYLLKIAFTDDEINRYIAHKEERRKAIENYLKENNIPLSEAHKYKQI